MATLLTWLINLKATMGAVQSRHSAANEGFQAIEGNSDDFEQ